MILSRPQRARIQKIARGRAGEPRHVLEGAKAVKDALEIGVVAELWLRRDLDAALAEDLRSRAVASDVPVGEGSREDFDRLADVVTPQGVLALVRDVGQPLAALVRTSGLLVWLDGVQDPGNVGAVVRVAAAFGAAGLLVGTGTADPLGLKALRASAGLALRVPFARGAPDALATALADRDGDVWALDGSGDDVLAIEDAPTNLTLVVGAEGPGLGAEARAAAVRTVGIPLAAGVDSLNAAVAAGITIAHLARRMDS